MAVAERTIAETPAPVQRARRQWLLRAYTYLVIGYLFVPIVVMIVFGFNDYRPDRFNLVLKRPTLEWWRTLFVEPDLVDALKNSFAVAALSTVVATILGTMIALALSRFRFKLRGALNLFIFLPMSSPEIVLGVALLSMFVTIGIDRGFLTIVIAHIMFSISYVVVTVKARTSTFDLNLEDAAQDLGADRWTTFWTVTFPLIFPAILAGALLAFVLSIDDYVITTFNAGGTLTFPLWIYGVSRFGVPPQVNVMGTILFLIGIIYVIVALRRAERN
jgi:spermidine/putrescine transport system permease protein